MDSASDAASASPRRRGIRSARFPTRRPYSFGYSPSLFRAVGKRIAQVDLVTIHSLNLFPQLSAYIHARRTKTPYIVTPHGSLDPWLQPNSPKRKAVVDFLWQRRMLNEAAAIQFTTTDEASLVTDVARATPSFVIPNGIRVDEFRDLPGGRTFQRDSSTVIPVRSSSS